MEQVWFVVLVPYWLCFWCIFRFEVKVLKVVEIDFEGCLWVEEMTYTHRRSRRFKGGEMTSRGWGEESGMREACQD